MALVSLPLGATNSGTNDWSDVHGEDQAIVDVVNGGIANANLTGSAAITDANLASPNNSAYREIVSGGIFALSDLGAGTYFMGGRDDNTGVWRPIESATNVNLVGDQEPPPIFYFDDADYTVGSKTQKLRTRAQVASNATASAITFTIGLYPVTVAGAADIITYTLGTVVTGSTVAIVTPAASTVTSAVNSDFAVPADGAYALGVVTSGALANNSAVSVHAQLQTRNV